MLSRPLFRPNCQDCKHFTYDLRARPVCKLFKFQTVSQNNETMYISSVAARTCYTLCGPDAWYFKPKKDDSNVLALLENKGK